MNTKYFEFKEKLKEEISSLNRNDEICLIAASKYYGTEEIIDLYNSGQKHFGENKLQEAIPKINELLNVEITWHFFGHVQTNKAKKIAEHFSYIHSVDSLKIAVILNEYALELNKQLKIFLQVNLAEETQKYGFKKETLLNDMNEILKLKALNIMGLMIITPYYNDSKESRAIFRMLKNFQDEINLKFEIELKYLSMGMSGDWKEALREGSTHLRVGRALFE